MNILIIGAPGSGKGTQSKLLAKKLNLNHFSIGDILREIKKENSKLSKKIVDKMDQGKYVNNSLIIKLVEEKINVKEENYIFDGFPRNVYQAKKFDKYLNKNGSGIDVIINLNIDEEESISRISNRLVCECGKSYHLENNPPAKENICDVCNKELQIRKDDGLKALKVRLEEYKKFIDPLINYYYNQGKVITIDANHNIDEISTQIIRSLKR